MNKELKKNETNTKYSLKKKVSILMGVFFAVTVLIVGGYYLLSKKPREPIDNRESITLGVSKSPLSAPVVIALEQAYFANESLDVTIRKYNSGKLALNGLFAGEVDISTTASTPIMFKGFDRQDFSILTTFVHSYNDVKMITRKGTGINTGADLKGRKVGVDMGTTSQFFLGIYLSYNGLSNSEVELIDIKTVDLPSALLKNEVEAISVWEPHAYNALQLLQEEAFELPGSEVFRTTFNLVATGDFTRDHPEAIKKVLRALIKAAAYIKTNKEESIDTVAEVLELDKEILNVL